MTVWTTRLDAANARSDVMSDWLQYPRCARSRARMRLVPSGTHSYALDLRCCATAARTRNLVAPCTQLTVHISLTIAHEIALRRLTA